MHLKHKVMAAGIGLAVILGGVALRSAFAGPGHEEAAGHSETEAVATATSVPVETASDGGLGILAGSNASWSGEILSLSDVSVHPSREGQISEWRVRLGQRVYAGQVLGRLAAPPANLELASALAERAQALVKARAAAEAAEKLVRESTARLAQLKATFENSRDASIATSAIEAEQAAAVVPLKRQALHSSLERLAYRTPGLLSRNGTSPSNGQAVATLQFKWGIGIYSESAQNGYRSDLTALLDALRDPAAIPEKEGMSYAKALQGLLSNSAAIGDMTEESLSDLRNDAIEDQEAFLDALDEYHAAVAAGKSKASELPKIAVETDKEIAVQKSEIDAKIAELERDLAEARADVEGAEAAYGAIVSGVAGQNIIAPRSGIVSAIHKNVGDHVTPEDLLAAIGAAGDAQAFVRFRIPSDLTPPSVGDLVTIERPGRSFAGVKAKVVGVGTALDENGSYAADAEFLFPTDWPVHASVRVVPDAVGSTSVLVPLGAVWKDDQGTANVWLVMENGVIRPQPILIGRTVGDRIEALEGLQNGDRYVATAAGGLKTGQSVNAPAGGAEKTGEPAEGGDGHGHSHGE